MLVGRRNRNGEKNTFAVTRKRFKIKNGIYTDKDLSGLFQVFRDIG